MITGKSYDVTEPHTFECIDGHTCGNPVRLVVSGRPDLAGETMSEKRQDFLDRLDWIRTSLMFEPRGHDMMSGSFLYPNHRDGFDAGILFIETSGCLPMCGHGTIGTVTMAIENGVITPAVEGSVRLEAPAGPVDIQYRRSGCGKYVEAVRIHNVASYLAKENLQIEMEGLGSLSVDVAYGGNYYIIVDPQENFAGLEHFTGADILRLSPLVHSAVQAIYEPVHPEDATIRGASHVLWAGAVLDETNDARGAVFYGDKAIDRSPCGTGTSARMAQLHAKGKLAKGDHFKHESIIGSVFDGIVEDEIMIGDIPAIKPSIEGWARTTGFNRITVDPRDPFWQGFQVV